MLPFGLASGAPDDDVGQSVAVDVAGGAHGAAGEVEGGLAADFEAVRAVEAGQINRGRKRRAAAEDDIRLADLIEAGGGL